MVHSGFYGTYSKIRDLVRTRMDALIAKHSTAPILITGHSLGGALAVLAAVDIKPRHPSAIIRLYTFGQPRVGDTKFANYVMNLFPESYIRVTHSDDTVVHSPALIAGFKHGGNEVWYEATSHNGIYKECPNFAYIKENADCSNSLWLKTGISAHLKYLGYSVSGQCIRNQPSGTLAISGPTVQLMLAGPENIKHHHKHHHDSE